MSRKIIIISIISTMFLIGAISFGFWKQGAENQSASASVSRQGLTLNLDFGNNNGSDPVTVYDSSGFGRHATSTAANAPRCYENFCDMDGTEWLTASSTNAFNSATISIAFKFSPDWAADDGALHYLYDSQTGGAGRYLFIKAADNDLVFYLGNTEIQQIPVASYLPYWKVGKENIVIIRGSATTDRTDMWLNGVKLLSQDTTAWAQTDPTTLNIGCAKDSTYRFDGKFYYLKVWNRLLTDQEVANLSADRETFVAAPPRTGLVGWWTMDSNDINGTTIYDKSGYNASSTIAGNPTIKAGKIGQALDFDATGDYIMATSTAYENLNAFTLSAWVKPDRLWPSNTSSNAFRGIMSKSTGGLSATINYLLDWYGDDGTASSRTLRFVVSNGIAAYSDTRLNFDFGLKWHHIVGVFDGSNIYLYDDGVLTSSPTAFFGSINKIASNFEIGRGMENTTFMWDGSIDDVRIYNYALSAQEISNLYSSAKTKYVNSATKTGLIGHWTMDANDTSATKVYDKSGKGNHGTPTGFYTGLAPTSTPGKINQAVNWDGKNGYISIPTFVSGDVVSWGAWVKTTGYALAGFAIDNQMAGASNAGFSLSKAASSAYATCSIDSSSDIAAVAGTKYPINDGKWHHAFCTKDASDGIGVYVDGVLDTSGTNGTADISSVDELDIGAYSQAAHQAVWDGAIDDVRIYNRVLSAQEVANIYNAVKESYQ